MIDLAPGTIIKVWPKSHVWIAGLTFYNKSRTVKRLEVSSTPTSCILLSHSPSDAIINGLHIKNESGKSLWVKWIRDEQAE